MRKREIFWMGVLLLLGWAYIHFFTTIGVTKKISVIPTLRPEMGRLAAKGAVYPVYFTLDGDYRLTSVIVTTTETNQANPKVHVLWHLVAKTNSAPVKFFQYGETMIGMTPDIKSARTEPLLADVVYHLELAAGKIKGGTDFKTRAIPAN